MEFGMFHEFQRLPGASDASAFADSFAQIDAAERMGLDAMWLAELHFAPERSVLASPMILAAAIAQRTKRMKVGTAVQVLPLCHPLRLAEEVATVDQLSNGRLIFGVGRSGFAHTYKTYGVDYGESRERFAETLTIVKRAFTEERFSHKGKYFAYDNVRLSPRPVQRPWPEIRVAAASPDTYEEMGTMGHAIFVAARIGNLSELAPNVKTYQAAWKAAGHPGKGSVFLRVPVYVADTEETEREVPRERIIVGTPPQVVDRLKEIQEVLGLDGILAELNPGSLIPHPQVMRALRLLCEQVIPAFK